MNAGQFKPGQSGNPNGRPSFRKALEKVLEENGGHVRPALERIAAKAVKKAISGDVRAMEFVADRLDGKPVQAIEVSGQVAIRYVVKESEDVP
mgnify:CR=1 FL=1